MGGVGRAVCSICAMERAMCQARRFCHLPSVGSSSRRSAPPSIGKSRLAMWRSLGLHVAEDSQWVPGGGSGREEPRASSAASASACELLAVSSVARESTVMQSLKQC